MDIENTRSTVKTVLQSQQWLTGLKEHKKRDVTKERPSTKVLQGILRDKGLPLLVFVDAECLQHGKIPRSDETHLLTNADDIDVENSFTFMVSHRWDGHGPSATPDDKDNSKSRSLFHFSQWFKDYWHGKGRKVPHKIYFWMDYFGIDQLDLHKRAAGIACLPLYISACSGTIQCMDRGDQFHKNGYYTRAWCLLECVLAYRFQLAGAAPFIIPRKWNFDRMEQAQYKILRSKVEDNIGVVKRHGERFVQKVNRTLLSPINGVLSDENDRPYIAQLVAIAQELDGLAFKNRKESTLMILGDTQVKARVLVEYDEV